MPQLDILSYQAKPPIPGKDYILLSHGPQESPQTLQDIANAIYYPSQHKDKALLLKIPLTYVIKMKN